MVDFIVELEKHCKKNQRVREESEHLLGCDHVMHISNRMYMYVYMYVCMYVCMHECMHACMDACMYVCMYVCMHICICGVLC
jgi:hypothetical protein